MYYLDVFKELNEQQVRYLVVGGLALVLHGVVRLTGDLDLIVDLNEKNLKLFLAAMKSLGFKPKLPVKAADFADQAIRDKWIREKNMKVFSFIHEKDDFKLIDVFPEEPLPFDEAYSRKQVMNADGVKINVISIDDLIALKKAAARPQDLKDIEMLRELKKR